MQTCQNMTALVVNIDVPRLYSCQNCTDQDICENWTGRAYGCCSHWRCRVCRGPWWAICCDHKACLATGVPNGVTYYDDTHMKPAPKYL
jgi:hypothetical protein